MTILQLKTAVTAEECGSIANAAKKLDISQPNASSSIRMLETEIGFPIFTRAKTGAVPTEKGKVFLAHARSILAESEKMLDLQNHKEIYRLRLGIVNYPSAADPFLELCRQHRDDPECDLCCYNVSILEGIRKLENFELDIIFAPSLKSQITGIRSSCSKKDLELISLGSIPTVINVRKDHPALPTGCLKSITQGSSAMKNYPYAAYRNLGEDSSSTSYDDENFAQSSYVIQVDSVDARLKLIASTNAFSFSAVHPKGVQERYGIVSFPVPGIFLEVFCLIRSIDSGKREINEYLTLLKEDVLKQALI